jgi:6-phosphogluconolactonase (cycloisomerase 2 family)
MHLVSRKWLRLVLPVLAGAAAAAAAPAASAAGHPSPVVDYVYVNDNTTGTNTIGAFERHANGSLTQIPGSPFAAGGAGTGSGLASQGALQLSPDGRYLIAVDAGSSEISVLRVDRDGTLTSVSGGVASSRGQQPVSVAIQGDLVYVANAGAGDSNFTGFRLASDGHLTHLAGSTIHLSSASAPGDVLFNGDGSKLIGTLVGTSQIDSFVVGPDGRLTAAPGSPFPAQGQGPFGSEFRPTNPKQLFVSNAHNVGAASGTVSAFRESPDGTLTSVPGAPFRDFQTAPCWVEISHDGSFLFTVNTASGSISSYTIGRGGRLTLFGTTPAKGGTATGAVDARLSPDGHWLFLVESKTGAVGTFAVDGGNLTEVSNSPTSLPAGAAPAGVVVK